MVKRLRPLLLVALVVMPFFLLLLPGSPLYLANLFGLNEPFYDGMPTSHWLRLLKSSDVNARRQGLHALGALGTDAGETVPQVSTLMLEDPDRGARIEASLALAKMAPASRVAVGALGKALSDKEPWVRMNAVHALLTLRKDARPAVPELIAAIKDETNRTNLQAFINTIQEVAAVTVGFASAGSDEAVPALIDALKTTNTPTLRMAAARGLGIVGPEARTAIEPLKELLKDKDEDLREIAARALSRIEVEPVLEH